MKLLYSSSSSASSSSTTTSTTFDGNMCKSKSAPPGCLTGVVRRLLCFNSLPTHPSDHIKEAEFESTEYDKLHYIKAEEKLEASATPGIVARLMGLDPMPLIDLVNTQKSPNSIARSKSMNYVETWRKFESKQGKHDRLKSSSFREAPAYLELENEEFFILSFENGGENKELGLKPRKSEMGFGELKQRKAEKLKNKNKKRENRHEKNKENQVINNISDEKLSGMVTYNNSQNEGNSGKVKESSNILSPTKNFIAMEVPIYHKENTERGRSRKKKKKEDCSPVKKVETESDSENSSPVSVLDFGEFPINLDVPTSEKFSRLKSSNSRRTLLEKLESYKHLSPCNTNNSIIDNWEATRIEGKCVGSRKKDFQGQNCVENWGEICQLAKTETMQSNSMYTEMWKIEDSEEIGTAFGIEILELLLFELVDQLTST